MLSEIRIDKIFLVRLVSITIVLTAHELFKSNDFLIFTFNMAMTHYTAALIFSFGTMQHYLQSRRRLLFFSVFLICALIAAWYNVPHIYYYFLIHHISTEVYYGKKQVTDSVERRVFFGLVFFLHAFLILSMIRLPLFREVFGNDSQLHGYLIVLFTISLSFYHWIRTKSIMFNEIVWATIAVLTIFTQFKFTFLQLVLYHFVFWNIMPFFFENRKPGSPSKLMFAGVLGTLSVIYLILTLGLKIVEDLDQKQLIMLCGHIHVSISILLSTNVPKWLSTRLKKL